MWFEREATPGRLLVAAGALLAAAAIPALLLVPVPFSSWPAIPAQISPWGIYSVSDRIALAALVASFAGLGGLVLTIAAAIVQLRALIPTREYLQFHVSEVRTPEGRRDVWVLRMENIGAAVTGYRVELVLKPEPLKVLNAPNWEFETEYQTGHGADSWILASPGTLYPKQFVTGPTIYLGDHNQVSISVRWWAGHTGPTLQYFWAGTTYPEYEECLACEEEHVKNRIDPLDD